MDKKLSKEILFTNPNAAELEHLFSYSQTHHVFNLTIMCIKYKVDYLNGAILNIEYHENYKNCFMPLMSVQQISDTVINMATSIINYYLDENTWLMGWNIGWNIKYSKVWNQKMILNPPNSYYINRDYEDSSACFLLLT